MVWAPHAEWGRVIKAAQAHSCLLAWLDAVLFSDERVTYSNPSSSSKQIGGRRAAVSLPNSAAGLWVMLFCRREGPVRNALVGCRFRSVGFLPACGLQAAQMCYDQTNFVVSNFLGQAVLNGFEPFETDSCTGALDRRLFVRRNPSRLKVNLALLDKSGYIADDGSKLAATNSGNLRERVSLGKQAFRFLKRGRFLFRQRSPAIAFAEFAQRLQDLPAVKFRLVIAETNHPTNLGQRGGRILADLLERRVLHDDVCGNVLLARGVAAPFA